MKKGLAALVLALAAGVRVLPRGSREAEAGTHAAAATARAHGPNGTPRSAGYTVVPVARPGRIEGTVTWTGPLPPLPALPVPPETARIHPSCGTSAPNPALEVDPASRGVRGAVLYLADITRGAAPSPSPVNIENRGCAFAPHVVATTIGAQVRFSNHDEGVLHNAHAYYGLAGEETMFNVATPPGVALAHAVDRGGIHRVVCDVGHTWMLAYVHAFPHPYYAVTDASGRYAIANVPPGTWRLHVWHEGWTARGTDASRRPVWSAPVEAEQTVTVVPDGAVTAHVQYTAAPSATFVLPGAHGRRAR
jgi:plastocyanin